MKREPARRRYRHHWEKAIAALEHSARGRDTAPALLEAARARYALYRFSQVDSDRTKALALASRAEKAGARDARAFRLAVREEMGEPPEREPKPAPRPTKVATATRNAAPPILRRESPPVRNVTPPVTTPAPVSAGTPTAPVGPLVVAPTPLALARPPAAAPALVRRDPPPSTPREEEASIDAILERALAGESAGGAPAPVATHARVAEIKSWSNRDYTRVAIYLSRNVAYQRVDLPEQPGRPRQVAIDLRPAKLDSAIVHAVGDALVQRVRAIQLDPDSVRVTMDLSGREDLTIFPLEEPARLLVDVGAAAAPAPPAVASSPARQEPDPAPRRTDSTPPIPPPPSPGAVAKASPGAPAVLPPSEDFALRGPIRRVVVDAGHGGHDTGAIGPTNVREKDVTLAMAKRLAKRLRARGYEVVLTRDDDRYLALEERTAIANARHGDLFVSLHANAHPRRDRRGVETYILNVSDDRYARRLAARENGAFDDAAADIPLLRRILSDLDAKMSVESSRRVAAAVLPPSEEFALRGPIRRVVVDAGHGGHDTGAIGPTNVREKDVTLAMAKRLAKRLRARGYEVVLTRDDDRYLALEERTAIANARHGDLFVSLHANAHPRRDRRGVETYILNVSDDRYARRLAARENGAFDDAAADIPLLRRILSDLDAKVSVESSRRVAAAVQHELCAGIRSRFGEVRDLGVKSALFYVLLGARMPAVLVETAFISNRAEEKRLASPTFQDEVAAAVVRAVERVGSTDARIAAAR